MVYLEGDLGAGKTALVRAALRALGYEGTVKSPTYSLVEFYTVSRLYCYHFDFYRFESPDEFFDAGLGEYFHGDAVCLLEWPQKAAGWIPPFDLVLRFFEEGGGRRVEAVAATQKGVQCLSHMFRVWQEGGCSRWQAHLSSFP